MSIKLTEDGTLWTSDKTKHNAGWRPNAAADGNGAWVVSWLPLRLLDRNQAITAMSIAELVDTGQHNDVPGGSLLRAWADELHLTADDAIAALAPIEAIDHRSR